MIQLRVLEPTRRVPADMIQKLAGIPVANISDVMARLPAGGPQLRPLHAGGVLAGTAYTVKTRPGDNLMIHKALNMASPGDVLVVDAGGDLTNSLVGEMMLTYAERRGLAGLVLNGAVRDLSHVRSHTFPVYAAGVTHRGPYKNGPGEINVPISLDGMIVTPGDAIIGDDDGVVCVPFADADKVHLDGIKKQKDEQEQMQAILAGTIDRSWVDKALAECGFGLRHE